MTVVLRIQFPVGHGGLHLTKLLNPEEARRHVNIVYDCGTRSTIASLQYSIAKMYKCVSASASNGIHIDLFVLSHLHRDHVNGFECLVAKAKSGNGRGLTIDRLVIPHYDDEDKLAVLAQQAHEGASASELAVLDLVLREPVTWFGERGVRQILAVAPPDRPPDPPLSSVPPLPDDRPPEGYRTVPWPEMRERPREPGPEVPERPTEPYRPATEVYVPAATPSETSAEPRYVILPPRSVIRVSRIFRCSCAAESRVPFVVIPHCLRSLPGRGGHRRRCAFVERVRAVLEPLRQNGRLVFGAPLQARRTIDDLRSAFAAYTGTSQTTTNRLSVLAYIGEDKVAPRHQFRSDVCTGRYTCSCLLTFFYETCTRRLCERWRPLLFLGAEHARAWLMTGDADLRRDREWRKVFGARLAFPLVLQAPHHGADPNFPKRIPRGTRAVFATCSERDPHHPGSRVVARLGAGRRPLLGVTTSPDTALVSLGWL